MFLEDCVKNKKGQVLIVGVIVVGAIGLLIAGTLLVVGLNSLKEAVTTSQSVKVMALNNGCAENALYYIRQLPSYTGSDNYTLDNDNICLFTVSNIGEQKKIELSSTVDGIIRKVEIILTIINNEITIDSWQDVP